MILRGLAALVLSVVLCAAPALAQQSSPNLVQGQVPTPAQWNSYFAGKLDWNANGLAVNLGGTGSTTSAGARTGLGAAASGANTDITSLGFASFAFPSISGAMQCLHVNSAGVLSGTGSDCGSGSGSVGTTGSPSSGNLTKFSASSTITNADLSGDCTTSGTLVVTCLKTNASAFGTAATQNIGTSGATVPLLNGANLYGGIQNYPSGYIQLLGSSTGYTSLASANAGGANYTATLFAATDQIVGRNTADTLTNKTLTSATCNGCTLTTPALGTPASGVATNLTGLPLTTGVSGLLPVGNGGTGDSTFTANAPVIGNGGSALALGSRSGSTTVFGTTSGTLTSGHCVEIDASGNLVDAGGICTTGGGGGTVSSSASNNLAYYASGGTTVTGLTSANSGVLITSGLGVPSISSTLPSGITLVAPALGTPASGTLTNATGLPVSTGISGLGIGVATALGVAVGSAGAPVLNGGALGTPSSGVGTNLTGVPISTGVSGLGTGVATALAAAPTGSGGVVLATSPTLVTPALGTPSSVTLTNATGLPISTGVSGLGTGVAAALGSAVTGSGGAVLTTSPTLVTPALGTPASGVATHLTGLPLTTGVTGALPVANGGTNASSASITAFNNITGYTAAGATGTTSTNIVFSTSPTLVTPALGTPSSATLTNATGLPISTGVSGLGSGVATALAVAVGSAGAPVVNGGVLGTPSSGTATNLSVTATGASTSRALPAYFADAENVINFGADPTGVANSSSAFNNAFGASGNVFIPCGTYKVNATWASPVGVLLSGGGLGCTKLEPFTTGTDVLKITSGNFVTIQNLAITTTSSSGNGIELDGNTGNTNLTNLSIGGTSGTNGFANGVLADGGTGASGLYIQGGDYLFNSGSGLNLDGTSGSAGVNDYHIVGAQFGSNATAGISATYASAGQITDDFIWSNGVGIKGSNDTYIWIDRDRITQSNAQGILCATCLHVNLQHSQYYQNSATTVGAYPDVAFTGSSFVLAEGNDFLDWTNSPNTSFAITNDSGSAIFDVEQNNFNFTAASAFTGSISGTTLAWNTVLTAAPVNGQTLYGASVPTATTLSACTGTTSGTCTTSHSATISSEPMAGGISANVAHTLGATSLAGTFDTTVRNNLPPADTTANSPALVGNWNVAGQVSAGTTSSAAAQMYPGTGATGQTGGGWLANTGNPTSGVGNNGDFYMRTDCTHGSSDCIWHKESGSWFDLN